MVLCCVLNQPFTNSQLRHFLPNIVHVHFVVVVVVVVVIIIIIIIITDDQRFMVLLSISCILKNLYFPILLHSFSPVQFLEQFPSPSSFVHLPFFPLSNHLNPFSTNLIRSLKPSLIYELSLATLFSAVMQCL